MPIFTVYKNGMDLHSLYTVHHSFVSVHLHILSRTPLLTLLGVNMFRIHSCAAQCQFT